MWYLVKFMKGKIMIDTKTKQVVEVSDELEREIRAFYTRESLMLDTLILALGSGFIDVEYFKKVSEVFNFGMFAPQTPYEEAIIFVNKAMRDPNSFSLGDLTVKSQEIMEKL